MMLLQEQVTFLRTLEWIARGCRQHWVQQAAGSSWTDNKSQIVMAGECTASTAPCT